MTNLQNTNPEETGASAAKRSSARKTRSWTYKLLRTSAMAAGGAALYAWHQKQEREHVMYKPFGYAFSQVTSGSMEPVIQAQDLVLIHQQESYKPGDIIIYRRDADQHLIIHRIQSIEGSIITTKGDANKNPDTPFDASRIQGKMIAKIPQGGKVLQFLKTPAGCALLAGSLVWSLLPEGKSRQ